MPTPIPALIAMEIERVLSDLDARRDMLVRMWAFHRDRWPLAEAAFSRWKTLRARQLDALSPRAAVEVDRFYEALEAWLAYVRTTEDMPLHLDWNWRQHHARLVATGRRALAVLDRPPTAPVPAADADGRSFLDPLTPREPRPPRVFVDQE